MRITVNKDKEFFPSETRFFEGFFLPTCRTPLPWFSLASVGLLILEKW